MKNKLTICILVIILSFTMSCINNTSNNDVRLVTAQEMQSILELEDAQLIDVRSAQEYEQVHIANSQNIDFTSPTFEQDISKLDKKKPVILYCKSGSRSAQCSKKMKDAGFEKVYDLEGGISKWKHSDKLKIQIKS